MRFSVATVSKYSLLWSWTACAFCWRAPRLLCLFRLTLHPSLLSSADPFVPHFLDRENFKKSKHVAITHCIWDSLLSHNLFHFVLGNRRILTLLSRIVHDIDADKRIKSQAKFWEQHVNLVLCILFLLMLYSFNGYRNGCTLAVSYLLVREFTRVQFCETFGKLFLQNVH